MPVREDDTCETLSARILVEEHRVYPGGDPEDHCRRLAGRGPARGVSLVSEKRGLSMTLDEQLSYLTKGCVDVVRAGELKTKLERVHR